MKKLAFLLFAAIPALAQYNPPAVTATALYQYASAPSTCTVGQVYVLISTFVPYYCSAANTWSAFGSGSGSGTVSSGTAGQLAYYSTSGTTVSGTNALPSGTTATTQTAGDNSTKVATTAYVATAVAAAVPAVTVSTSGPVTVSAAGYYINNAAGNLTYNLPTITSGLVGSQFCFRNNTAGTGIITLQEPASTQIDAGGAVGSTAGTYVSGGALGDSACVVAISTTLYMAYPGGGSWTNH